MNLSNLIEKLKPCAVRVLNCTAFFIVVYLVAWAVNGIYLMHFDLSALTNFYMLLVGKQTADHAVNSIFNSGKGEMPDKK